MCFMLCRITVADRFGDILWSSLGNYTYVVAAYFWKDVNGKFSLVTVTEEELEARHVTNATTAPFTLDADNLLWPGSYPSMTNDSKEELVINVKWDNKPEEATISTQMVFAQSPTVPTGISSVSKKFVNQNGTKAGQMQSYPIEDFNKNGALYLVQITDDSGDGICCDDGKGW